MTVNMLYGGRPRRWPRVSFERVVLIGTIAFVGYLLSRYDVCFQDGEGLIRKFMFDEGGRARFIGYLAYILTIETRLALWDLIPPHPSFTPIWILTLVTGPVLLFKFLHLELRSRPAAMAGVAVYLVSTGCLSGATMLFTQTKPLANVVIIATLYLAARINERMRGHPEDGGTAPTPPHRLWVGLLVLLTVGPFIDETVAFAYVIVPVWCPYVFWSTESCRRTRSQCVRNRLIYAVPACLVALAMFAVVPTALAAMGRHFNLLEYLKRMAGGGRYMRLDPVHVVWHAGNLLMPGLVPWGFARVATPVTDGPALQVSVLTALAIGVLVVTEMVRRRRVYWDRYCKLGTLMVLFVVFQSLVLVFHPQELSATGFYYGAAFSVLFASLMAVVLADVGERGGTFGVAAARLGLLWVLIISAVNFMAINATWTAHSNAKTLEFLRALPTYGRGDWTSLEARRAEFT